MEAKFHTPPNCELLDYSVLSLGAARKEDSGSEAFDLRTGMRILDDERAYEVSLWCAREEVDFSFSCGIEGRFRYHEPIAGSNARNAWINGCMILYGLIRGLYATTASQCVHRTPVLPSVMMVDVVNHEIDEIRKTVASSTNQQPAKKTPSSRET